MSDDYNILLTQVQDKLTGSIITNVFVYFKYIFIIHSTYLLPILI